MEPVVQAVAPVEVMEPTPVAVAVIEPEPVAVAAAVAAEPVAVQAVEAPEAPSGPGMEYPPTDPMEPDQALATAEREGLTLLRADNKAGYQGVAYVAGKARAYQAIVRRRGETVRLGRFFTPEEAALCRARTPEGQLALKKAATNDAKGAFMTADEAEQQAAAEGLVLQKADSQTGFLGVSINHSSNVKRFEARVRRGGKSVHIGHFATPEAAALNVARAMAEGDGPTKRKRKDPTASKDEGDYAPKKQAAPIAVEVQATVAAPGPIMAPVPVPMPAVVPMPMAPMAMAPMAMAPMMPMATAPMAPVAPMAVAPMAVAPVMPPEAIVSQPPEAIVSQVLQ